MTNITHSATTNNGAKRVVFDAADCRRALSILPEPGAVFEIRVLNTRRGTQSGYFNDLDAAVQAAGTVSGKVPGVYLTLNPVNSDLLARAVNRLQPYAKQTTADTDILRRRWLPIDLDPIRPAGISSTDDEHGTALERARECRDWLVARDWPEPILADSGNGAHLLCRVDLPNDDDSRGLIGRSLKALALQFDDERVQVDVTTANAAQIWKLYGTFACKGDNTPGRPHRLARLLETPESDVRIVNREQLESLASLLPEEPARQSTRDKGYQGEFNLADWIQAHGLPVVRSTAWHFGTKWILNPCPWNLEHTNNSAFIVQRASGKIGAGCKHHGCAEKGWHDLRDVYEPGWREHRGASVLEVRSQAGAGDDWPVPQPLPDVLAPVELFEPALLPEAFRPWITDIADRMQCPIDFPAVGAMVALAAVVGRQLAIRPGGRDDWTVVPNLWGGVVGRPGLLKTPALAEVLRPLDALEARGRDTYQSALADHQAGAMVAEEVTKQAKKDIAAALRNGGDAQAIARASRQAETPPPARQRYMVNDSTVEKLGEILQANPRGVLLFRDELVGFLKTLEREGHEADRAFFLEGWNGTGRFTYDRIGRGTIDLESTCVSILGGIQPGPLSVYLSSAARGGGGDDGLVQRFQLLVWPDLPGVWHNVDTPPDAQARQRAFAVFARLNQIKPATIGAELPPDGSLPFLRFTPAAQVLFVEWRGDLESRLRGDDLPPLLEGHLSKYRSLIPTLALLIHLADAGNGPVDEGALMQACAWGDYLESHAQRLYGMAMSQAGSAAHTLAKRIQTGDLGREFALRDVQRMRWSGLVEVEAIKDGLEFLESLDWVRYEKIKTEGRPRERYFINPHLFGEG